MKYIDVTHVYTMLIIVYIKSLPIELFQTLLWIAHPYTS